MIRFLLIASLFAPACAFAQKKKKAAVPAPPPPHIHEMAEKETLAAEAPAPTRNAQTQKASEVTVGESAFLRLKDPGLNVAVSPWKWTVGLRVQNFSPSGSAEMRNGQSMNLSSVDAYTVPFLEVGSLYQLPAKPQGQWSIGASLEGGLGTKTTEVRFPTGAFAPNTRLNTSLLGANLLATYRHPAAAKWEGLLGWNEGIVTYSHSSDNDGANFSESARYGGWRLGLSYEASRNWLVGIEQSQRSLRQAKNDIDLPHQSTSISTRVTW